VDLNERPDMDSFVFARNCPPAGVASPASPYTDDDAPVRGVLSTPTVSDTLTFTAGRAIGINTTTAGNIKFGFPDGSFQIIPVAVGYTQFSIGANRIYATGTTAVATYSILK
jgi:hypothetical protein